MNDIIQKILFSPFFGIVLSLIAYEIGKYFFSKTKSIFCNPLFYWQIKKIRYNVNNTKKF